MTLTQPCQVLNLRFQVAQSLVSRSRVRSTTTTMRDTKRRLRSACFLVLFFPLFLGCIDRNDCIDRLVVVFIVRLSTISL